MMNVWVNKYWQKIYQMEVFKDSLESIRSNPKMLDNIITQNDSWVYGYDLEKKFQCI